MAGSILSGPRAGPDILLSFCFGSDYIMTSGPPDMFLHRHAAIVRDILPASDWSVLVAIGLGVRTEISQGDNVSQSLNRGVENLHFE